MTVSPIKFAAASKRGGIANTFPDVCKTPAGPSVVPLPYPNIAQLATTDDTSQKVLIEKKDSIVETSVVKRTSGGEPGTLKGVVSSTQIDECRFEVASAKVFFEGKRAVFHTAATSHNGSNANMPVGIHSTPSQSKVLIAS